MNHWIIDGISHHPTKLNDRAFIERTLLEAVEICRATIVDICIHQFSPQGVTGTITLAESHLSIHTWPENGFVAMDLFFCNPKGDPEGAINFLIEAFELDDSTVTKLERGRIASPPNKRLQTVHGTITQ